MEMAESSITVMVTHASSKHNITLTGQDGNEPTLKDLSETLAQATGVPQASQKIIFKGKSLKEMKASLSSLGIKQGCKLMMIGNRGFLVKDLQAEALDKLDNRVTAAAEQFIKILEEINAMTVPENFSDCRMKKKGLVKTVQGFLAQCNKLEAGISAHRAKIQNKNLALTE
ncbi:BAG family molecular chaperone regulator 1-like isoform X2 [Neoarius graeffei]|uniref:BAG family molecular chaperone regulator 1-like isoform X2 n=1 Tax=Neoarius graeffei TaxID=443677 RepID=UPI00298D30C9|nr:BAG family molecular chaperone regulator 1-like isoform X2 [Neoarius graeffei]